MRVEAFKKLEETMQIQYLLKTPLSIYFNVFPIFLPKFIPGLMSQMDLQRSKPL